MKMDHVLSASNGGSTSNDEVRNSDTTTQSEIVQEPLYFNYHEFAENYYADLDSAGVFSEHDEDHSIYITHFPNIYVPKDSDEFNTTRIVRIPRRFDTTLETPYFSTCLPGREPAAYTNSKQGQQFVAQGLYDEGQLFGCSSVSPLSKYLDQWDFEKIITPVNKILSEAFAIYTWYNLVDFVLDIVTLGCWHFISKHVVAHPLQRLELYVQQVNEMPLLKNNKIKIISPRRTGYLSVSIKALLFSDN